MLRARLTTEMKEAMKAGDKPRLGTVRMVQAALKERDATAYDVRVARAGRSTCAMLALVGLLTGCAGVDLDYWPTTWRARTN